MLLSQAKCRHHVKTFVKYIANVTLCSFRYSYVCCDSYKFGQALTKTRISHRSLRDCKRVTP
jgi:hypothetical protein